MPNLSPTPPITIQMTDTLLQMVGSLKPDQQYHAVVKQTPQGLSARVNGLHILLPEGSSLVPGQSVTVQLQSTASGMQIIVHAGEGVSAPIAATPTQTHPMVLLAKIMQEMPTLLSLSPEAVAALVPRVLPSSEAIIRLALQIFQFQAQLPEAVATLIRALRHPSAQDTPDSPAAQLLALLGGEVDFSKAESISRFLKVIQKQTLAPPLAALQGKASLTVRADSHLYLLLAGVRNDQAILETLEPASQLKSFRQAAETLMEHTAGQHIQNARSLEIPYSYMNLPIADEGVRQAQIHIFGEGRGPNQSEGAGGQIVIDLETTKLGSVWIHLQHGPDQCTCRFDVATEEIANQFNAVAAALAARLEAASFKNVSVQAAVFEGDRMMALAELFQSYRGLDLKA